MKFSLNTIRKVNEIYSSAGDPAPDGVDALLVRIGGSLGAVEDVMRFGERFKGAVVARVVTCEDHPNADRLHVCIIDDGGKTPDLKRDENGHVQVVCGAPNVRAGLTVVWLPPGTTVPESLTKDPFVLETRDFRGVASNGMLASPRELTLGDSHEGILELDTDAAPGTPFVDAYNLVDEAVIDIENKMFTHRPDCFGSLGIARELEGIQHRPYKSPAWYTPKPDFPAVEADELPLEVRNEVPGLVPRFTAIAMAGITIKPSPVWLQILLAEIGVRSINNIVDYTNFFMLETGQPLHAYDYDKVKAIDGGSVATLVVRNPKSGEKLLLLGGKEVEPRAEAILIATEKQAIGLGGVMGGADTEVDENTKNVIIEVATFDMYSIRRTSMAHGLFTDAVTRFSKGQSPLQNLAVLAKIVDEIRLHANGKVASEVIDINQLEQREWVHPPVPVTAQFINERLGFELIPDEMKQLLENVEFKVAIEGDKLTVTAPFWRTDIETREDVVEEVGRLYGYDKLPLELPRRSIKPATKDAQMELKQDIRETLATAGANEVLTYSFVHGDLLDKVGQDKAQAFQVSNALSPDLQYYRLSLTPSLLEKVHPNIKAGYSEFALFELGKAHVQGEYDADETEIPKEVSSLSLVYGARKARPGAAYYQAHRYLDDLLTKFGAAGTLKLEPLEGADLYGNPWLAQMVAPFEPTRSAVLRDTVGVLEGSKGLVWGVVGEFKASVRRSLKLPDYSAGFELDPLLFWGHTTDRPYVPLPRFPKVTQDITLKVGSELSFAELSTVLVAGLEQAKPVQSHAILQPLGIYQSPEDPSSKHVSFRLEIASYEKTLTDAEVSKLLDVVTASALDKLGAERV